MAESPPNAEPALVTMDTAAGVNPPEDGAGHPYGYPPRPRVVIVADLLPALSTLSLVALSGLPLAWLWSRLAPPTRVRVTQDNTMVPLPTETYHRFDGVAIFLVLTFGAGVLIGALVWALRRRRGPVIMIGAVFGALLAAWVASGGGLSLAAGLFPAPDQLTPGAVFDRPPVLDVPWLILAAPMGTAFAYGAATAWNGSDDLGRRR